MKGNIMKHLFRAIGIIAVCLILSFTVAAQKHSSRHKPAQRKSRHAKQNLAVKPPATPTFEEIRSRVESEFKNERVVALLSQRTQELSDRAKAEHDLKKAAKELGAAVKTSDFVLPDGQVPDIGSMAGGASVAFSMKPDDVSGPIVNGNTGVVLVVNEKQDPTPQEFEAKKDQVRDSLLQSKQQEMFGLFVTNLRTDMEKSGKIKINREEMNNLTKSREEG